LPHLVDIVRAAVVVGPYGSTDVLDWAAATTTAGVAAFMQPQSSEEQVADAERVTTRWRLFLAATADLKATDRVVWSLQTFEVDGDVEAHQGMSGATRHKEALLRRVTMGG
jgi:hypothetical protein